MDLATFLHDQLTQMSYRDMVARTGVSKGALENLVKRRNKKPPEIETLERIANGFNLPLWRVMQMAGYDLDLPDSDQAARLLALAEQIPELRAMLDDLLNLPSEQRRVAASYLEYLHRETARAERGSDSGSPQ